MLILKKSWRSYCLGLTLIVMLVAVLEATVSHASDIDRRHIKEMLRHVHEMTGMEVPDENHANFPNVVFVDQNFINGLVCKKRNCNAQAATKNSTVFLVDGLNIDGIEGESILYHELVHVAQYHNWGNNENCKSWIKREVQAYQLQDNFVSEKGHDMPWLRSVVQYLAHMCPQ